MNMDRYRFRVWDVMGKKYCNAEGLAIRPDGAAYIGDCMLEREYWIIEQCTGLRDKNGKLIYEGDIVTIYNPLTGAHDECRVAWDNDSAGYVCLYLKKVRIRSYNTTYLDGADCSVIGNIHEEER